MDAIIRETQEHIIEMDGVKYHLENVSTLGLERPRHQPWCVFCDGNGLAPKEDMDRLRLFDNYCYGHQRPLLCCPERGFVYKRVSSPNFGTAAKK